MEFKKYELSMLISGGQTGADRAGLDFALFNKISCSGWCPKGRIAEDGIIPLYYPLKEASTEHYPHRTRLNVKDSDATFVFVGANPSRGTALTIKLCVSLRKPYFIFPITLAPEQKQLDTALLQMALAWLHKISPNILNIAGPRAQENQDIYIFVIDVLTALIARPAKPRVIQWPPEVLTTPSFDFDA